MKIYHNPRCKKSRETLKLIEEAGISVEIIKYLEKIPSEKELTDVIEKLKIPAVELLRKGETLFKENYKGKKFSNKEWIQVMVKNPKLIERPIVVKGEKAIIGRPPENVKELL